MSQRTVYHIQHKPDANQSRYTPDKILISSGCPQPNGWGPSHASRYTGITVTAAPP
jgi:hypothetical protein